MQPPTLALFKSESRLAPTELAKRESLHVSTVWRWLRSGILSGQDRVRLESIRIGGRTYITEAQYERFLQRLNAPTSSSQPETAAPSSAASFCEAEGL